MGAPISTEVEARRVAIGRRVTEARVAKGLSPGQLARRLFISRRTMDRWTEGLCAIPSDLIPEIGRLLDVSVAWLYGIDEAAFFANDAQTRVA